MSDEAPLLKLAVCLMAGIVVGQYVPWPCLPLLAGAVVVALLLWRWPLAQSVAIAASFVLLGSLLMQRQQEYLSAGWPEGEVSYEAVVVSEPAEKAHTMAVDLLLTGSGRRLKGYFHKDDRSRALRVGDGLRIRSRIDSNPDWHRGTFSYRRYLETHGFTGTAFISSRQWQKTLVSLSDLSRLERARLFFLRLRSGILGKLRSQAGGGDAYSVVAAMALGDKSALTTELKDVYSVTGASHVLALSGLHLGIIYTLLTLLLGGRRSLFTVPFSLFTIVSVWAFVLLVGMPVSVVRAAVMLTVYSLLTLGRRDRMSVNTLAFTAIVILVASPLSLFDVGFQLSFVAVLSILLGMPLYEGLVSQEYLMTHCALRWVGAMTAVSLSAQVGVSPLVAYYFGRFSSFFLLTNFIVVPTATLILYLSLMAMIVPALMPVLLFVVTLLNSVLSWVASLPGASVEGLHPSWIQVIMTYVIFVAVYMLLRIAMGRRGAASVIGR